jgi:hypothetical protein
MAQVSGTTDSYDLVGVAEDIEDVIFNISPTETPLLTMAGRKTAENTLHQWQTDALANAAANRQIEGDDAAYATAAPTTMLSNYTQISRKTLLVSRTADKVRKYGRDSEMARLIAKYGKELKRDIEFSAIQNQASSAGGSATARSSAGIESMIAGNRILPTTSNTGTTPGYAAGAWSAPTDGTATGAGSTLTEDYVKSALEASWQDGGDPSLIMTNTYQKKTMAGFAGANKFAGNYIEGGRSQQGVLVAGVDMYISDFGEHKIKLNRYQRQRTLLCLDPEYVDIAWLDGIKVEELAKTGDANKKQMICEWTLVVGNPDAHAKIQDLFSA